jgi:hypothetical protein
MDEEAREGTSLPLFTLINSIKFDLVKTEKIAQIMYKEFGTLK